MIYKHLIHELKVRDFQDDQKLIELFDLLAYDHWEVVAILEGSQRVVLRRREDASAASPDRGE